jgi:hypothetical protein
MPAVWGQLSGHHGASLGPTGCLRQTESEPPGQRASREHYGSAGCTMGHLKADYGPVGGIMGQLGALCGSLYG